MAHSLRRSLVVLLAIAGAATIVMPAFGQSSGPTGEFSYSPAAQQRGQSVQITGKCVNGASTDENLVVTVQQGADGNGGYQFPPKVFPAAPNGSISGTITVPGDAPFGDYLITGSCRTANNSPYFTKIGPFAVVERASDVTTTTAAPPPRATTTTAAAGATTTTTTTVSTTTSTTVPETTTTTSLDIEVFVPEDDDATPSTTIDEFAGTRNEDDDDSIGPLLLIIGVVPLVLAIAAIAFALVRRRNTPA